MAERVQLSVKKPEAKRENKASQTQKKGTSQSISSPVEQILFLQRTIGNQAVGRLLKSGALQAKLKIGQPGDIYEQEADRMAEQVMLMHEPEMANETKVSNPARNNSIQRKCPGCNKGTKIGKGEEEEKFQKKEASGSTPEVTPELESSISAVRGGGQPLSESARAFYEPRFGHDFSQVRVHADAKAAEAARSVNARAFTVGKDVVFGKGEYAPGASEGSKLLAHELTHVVQQRDVEQQSTILPSIIANATIIRREPDTGGMTPANAPASVPALPPEPTASIPTAADTQNRDLIKKALESRDPADVKQIKNFALASQADKFKLINILLEQGWVGPYDEYALEAIWGSFGDSLVTVASENFNLWNDCIERGAELYKLPAVTKLKGKFESDIKTVVTGYLFQNRQLVMDEMQRLGIPAEESPAQPAPTPEQTDEIERMQRAAAEVAKLQRAQEEARKVPVGYELREDVTPMGDRVTSCNTAVFNPYVRPEAESSPGNILLICPPGPITPYDKVKEEYDKATKSIEGFLNLYPSLYAISREGQSTTTAAFAAITSPAQARQQLGVAMRKLFHDIEETQIKLDGGDLNPLDLTPIHDQLLGGLKSPSGVDWKLRLPESVAKDMVKDHQFAEAMKALGLQTAAAAMFMLAPFTGGASIYVMLGGLAVTGVKLYLSTEQYETLAQAAKTSPKPGTELVTKGQVDEAKMVMEADQIAFALAALAVGTAIAVKVLGAIKGPKTPGKTPPGETPEGGPRRLINNSTPDRYLVRDSANLRLQAEAHIEGEGELSITLRTELESGERSPLLRGSEQFQNMLKHFGGRVKGIRGSWSFGSNLAKFNKLTGSGMSTEEAALQTWTGENAAGAGYTKVRVQYIEGTPGNYTKVNVLFY